jgi:hypothetical protein
MAVTDEQWQQQLRNNELNNQREQQAKDQAIKQGKGWYSWSGVDGTGGTANVRDSGSNRIDYLASGSGDAGASGSGGTSNSSSNSSSSLFGSGSNSLFGTDGSLSSLVDQSKDLAKFRLGLDQQQATFSRGLREDESQADFGRNTKLADQQIQGQFGLEDRRQNATTGRLNAQLTSQQLMQQHGFDQQNLYRSQSAALASRGLR